MDKRRLREEGDWRWDLCDVMIPIEYPFVYYLLGLV